MIFRRPSFRTAPVLALLALLLSAWAGAALGEGASVSVPLDPAAPPVQARQQALDRAFAEAVFQEAQRILPGPLPAPRAEALRRHLEPMSRELVLSYQETGAGRQAQQGTAPSLDVEVEVNRAALGQTLLRLGLLAPPGRPRAFSLRLASGVTEQDAQGLEGLMLLSGLVRSPATPSAPVEVSLERTPQGYFKGVLRLGAKVFVADSSALQNLWLELWGQYFAAREQEGGRGLSIIGFATVDGALEFSRVLASWDDAVQDTVLAEVDARPGGISGRWTMRVVNQERLDTHLREHLPGRGLSAQR